MPLRAGLFLVALLFSACASDDGSDTAAPEAPADEAATGETDAGETAADTPASSGDACAPLGAEEASTLLGVAVVASADETGTCSFESEGDAVSVSYQFTDGPLAYDMMEGSEAAQPVEGFGERAFYLPLLTTVSGQLYIFEDGRTLVVSGSTLGQDFRPKAEAVARAVTS
jgi:hypothetical protein